LSSEKERRTSFGRLPPARRAKNAPPCSPVHPCGRRAPRRRHRDVCALGEPHPSAAAATQRYIEDTLSVWRKLSCRHALELLRGAQESSEKERERKPACRRSVARGERRLPRLCPLREQGAAVRGAVASHRVLSLSVLDDDLLCG